MSNITKIKTWLLPVIVALGLFVVVRPVIAQVLEPDIGTLEPFEVGEEVNDGLLRVYYLEGDNKIFVSDEENNSKHAHLKGEYIVWVTEPGDRPGQIYRYHVPSGFAIQITNSGTNLKPVVSLKGEVVWERWTGDRWQLFFFDGKSTVQLTSGDVSVNADIEGDSIVYAKQNASGTWTAVGYSISQDKTVEITIGSGAKHPRVENGEVFLGAVGNNPGEKFILTLDDLFLLGFDKPQATPSPEPTKPETVTEKEVKAELTATPSAILEATPSAQTE